MTTYNYESKKDGTRITVISHERVTILGYRLVETKQGDTKHELKDLKSWIEKNIYYQAPEASDTFWEIMDEINRRIQ